MIPSTLQLQLFILFIFFFDFPFLASTHGFNDQSIPSGAIDASFLTVNSIPPSTRLYWMRQANRALIGSGSACPFAAFGTVIVNHTGRASDDLGTLICTGINQNSALGNPTLHGEISAISNCSTILTSPSGPYKLTPSQATKAFSQLSLYTNAESCPMCASAIRWSNFKEYIYGTSIGYLVEKGWGQIRIGSYEVFERSGDLPGSTVVVAGVGRNETDGYFAWQYDGEVTCPVGCVRKTEGGRCVDIGP